LTPSQDAQNQNDAQQNFDAQSEYAYPSRTDRERVSLRLSKEKYDQLQTWCFLHNMKFQKAIEKALDLLFDAQFENDAQPDWASRRPHRSDLDESDDLIDDKLSLIIQFFEKWTGTKIKDKEKFKYSYEGIRHLDIKIIEIGILLSVFRSKTKINSLNYCLNTIQEAAEAKIGNPDDYIKNIIKHLEKKNKNTVKG
jgi:hypothetical protein